MNKFDLLSPAYCPFEVSALPDHADYKAGYAAGIENAKLPGEPTTHPDWQFVPEGMSIQWGLGHAQAMKEIKEGKANA